MRSFLRDVLACPRCSGALLDIDSAVECRTCGIRYPVTNGVPRFVDSDSDRSTAASFSYEFGRLDPATTAIIEAQDEIYFFRATGLDDRIYAHVLNTAKRADLTSRDIAFTPDGSSVRGKLVLDAGCGAGRFTRLLARWGACVVALDLSDDAVRRVANECKDMANVAAVQGDVMRPPLREGSFDYVFSIGVLHHTRNTRRALASIARLVRPGGTLSVWVYGHDYWGDPIRGAITRTLRSVFVRLPLTWRAAICRDVFLPIGRVQMRLARRRLTKLLFAPLFTLNVPRHEDTYLMLATIFDYWATPVVRTHRPEELYDWFVHEGFTDIRVLPTPVAVRGRRPE